MVSASMRLGGAALRRLPGNERGAVLIEAAACLAILIVLLSGIVTYGVWFMSAHSLQQVANESARAVLGGLTAGERQTMVDRSIANSLLDATLLQSDRVSVATQMSGNFYTVTLSYDASDNAVIATSLLPVPSTIIVRRATVEVVSL